MTDRDAIAGTLWGEARGETTSGRLAVASVIQNRVKAQYRGTTYTSVCQAPWQFSCWNVDDPNRAMILKRFGSEHEVEERLRDPIVRECYWIADGLLANDILPQVGKSLHYYAKWMKKPPAWAAEGTVVKSVGSHVFMEGVK